MNSHCQIAARCALAALVVGPWIGSLGGCRRGAESSESAAPETPPASANTDPGNTDPGNTDPARPPGAADSSAAVQVLLVDPRSAVRRLQADGVELTRNEQGNIEEATIGQWQEETAAALARLPALRRVVVSAAPESLGDEGLRPLLASAVRLDSLEARGAELTTESLDGIELQVGLRELLVGGTRVDDRLLERLAKLAALEVVDLSWTRVTGGGLRRLRHLPLKSLDLSYTAIGDAELATLQGWEGLETLVLEGTSVSADSLNKLRTSLPETEIR